MELLQVEMGIYSLEMCYKMVRYQMSHCYVSSKSKTNIKKWYLEDFRANNFPALNKKDPVYGNSKYQEDFIHYKQNLVFNPSL